MNSSWCHRLALAALAAAFLASPSAASAVTLPDLPGASPAPPEQYGQGDSRGFRNILPPGTTGTDNALQAGQFLTSGALPPHARDQLSMYEDLVYATPGLKASEIPKYFKDATFGVAADNVERSYHPAGRAGTTVVRDKQFGVPKVYGQTRPDVMFGAGYVGAEDRLFFMDVLRHAGRAQLSGFAGGANKAMDREQWQIAPYNESDLQLQYDLADEVYGGEGAQLQRDVQNYVAGVNAYIGEARLNPIKLPAEYAAIGRPLLDWKPTDLIATASLVGGIFGKGGGREVDGAQVLNSTLARFGAQGKAVWSDFRSSEDPEAPTTVHGKSFPYQAPGKTDPNAVAMPDPGSVVPSEPQSNPLDPSGLGGTLAFPPTESNALLVSGAHTKSGRPLAVMGPQVAYFMPQILIEQELHCVGECSGGPDIDSAGAAFAGVNLFVLLGHGRDYAWSATSAGQDIIDTFAEKLCEPDGSAPTKDSEYYMYRGECRPMETLTRTNVITPNAADQSAPEVVELEAQRTVHGIVTDRGTVGGKPVAFAKLRSTYFHEADSALGFSQINDPNKVKNAEDFQRVMSKVGFTFNWLYSDDRDIAYFNSGNNPVRAPGVDNDLPVWGTGDYDWRNFNTVMHSADYTPFEQHPRVINQNYLTSWNNKQAKGYRAAEDNWAYGSLYRSQPLDDRIKAGIAGGKKMALEQLIDAMEDAGTVDLRGDKVLPWMLQMIGTPSDPELAQAVTELRAWLADGAHRRDRDRSGAYEHSHAIQIMDAWWPRAVRAEFEPALGSQLFDQIEGMIGLDNAPNNHGDHLGSAYQAGWYGYVQKDLRRMLGKSVPGALSRKYCGDGVVERCRNALMESLRDALTVPAESLYHDEGCTDGDQMCFDAVRFRAIGAITVPSIHWINRPTFQQAAEIQAHRPR